MAGARICEDAVRRAEGQLQARRDGHT